MVSSDVSPRGPTSLVREKQRSKRGVAGLGSIPGGRPELVTEAADVNITYLRTCSRRSLPAQVVPRRSVGNVTDTARTRSRGAENC